VIPLIVVDMLVVRTLCKEPCVSTSQISTLVPQVFASAVSVLVYATQYVTISQCTTATTGSSLSSLPLLLLILRPHRLLLPIHLRLPKKPHLLQPTRPQLRLLKKRPLPRPTRLQLLPLKRQPQLRLRRLQRPPLKKQLPLLLRHRLLVRKCSAVVMLAAMTLFLDPFAFTSQTNSFAHLEGSAPSVTEFVEPHVTTSRFTSA